MKKPHIFKGALSRCWICAVFSEPGLGLGDTPEAAYKDWVERCSR
jgi:hypothetical protein